MDNWIYKPDARNPRPLALTIRDGLNEHQIATKQYRGKLDDPQCVQCVSYYVGRWPNYKQCDKVGKVQDADGNWWCNTHSPDAVAARKAKREAKWEAENAKWNAEWLAKRAFPDFREALEKIRDGHNDPRSLAAEVLAKHIK